MNIPLLTKNPSLTLSTKQFISFGTLLVLAVLSFAAINFLTVWMIPVSIVATVFIFQAKLRTVIACLLLALVLPITHKAFVGIARMDCGNNCVASVTQSEVDDLRQVAAITIAMEAVLFFSAGNKQKNAKSGSTTAR
jgi:hypothetical protein